jgi:outer membrane protein
LSDQPESFSGGSNSVALSAEQPLYTSGAVRAEVESASANVNAGRQDLRQAEADLLLKVITAYEDVRLHRETLRVLESEIAAISAENLETTARGEIGDLTGTDITQSQARLLEAKAALLAAKSKLNVSNAAYLDIVGQNPGELAPPPELPGVPTGADEAFDAADHANPGLLAAIEMERAAHAEVNKAKAAFGPNVSLRVDAGITPIEVYIPGAYTHDVTVTAQVTQPIYTSGLNASKVREALEEDNLAQFGIETARRAAVQSVAQAWDQLISTGDVVTLQERQVQLESDTVAGYRAQREVGLRTTLELLNAELELATDQVSLLQSRHDAYIARGSLLAAIGRLELAKIASGAPTYDPIAASKRVAGRFAPPWIDGVAAIDSIGTPTVSQARPVRGSAGSEAPVSTHAGLSAALCRMCLRPLAAHDGEPADR